MQNILACIYQGMIFSTIKILKVHKRFYKSSFIFYSDHGTNEISMNMYAKLNRHRTAKICEIKSLNFNNHQRRFLSEKQDYIHVKRRVY